jgi:ElaB/YqjD/DUF883 family membrane-anchored ribosome-binding protein
MQAQEQAENGFPFSREMFVGAFDEIKPLLLEEWPELDAASLDAIDGDPDEVVELVAKQTQHSKTLVKKHLAEIAEVVGVDAATLEQRLVRLLHLLEAKVGPVQDRVRDTTDRAKTAFEDFEDEGKRLLGEVKDSVPRAEEKLRENIWVSLFAALGLGLLLGLIVGLSGRGR